jgi:hypothetical protein
LPLFIFTQRAKGRKIVDKPSLRIGNTAPTPPAFRGYQVEVYLKTGHTIKLRCELAKFHWDSLAGEYIGYEFNGLKEPRVVDLDPKLIAGYIVK